jgi:hypothetical protein
MSINKSYFSKNNTLISNSFVNTGRNPVTELFFGANSTNEFPSGYSRFIFNLDLSLLVEKINDGTISTTCQNNMTHILRMVNTTNFDIKFLNTSTPQGRKRATSFDLILFRIPNLTTTTAIPVTTTTTTIPPISGPQIWDEGVGYDFANLKYEISEFDKNYSVRPSNWFQTTTIGMWTEPGIYNNTNNGIVNYDDLTIIDAQHFEFGDENIEFDMTDEINSVIDSGLENVSGWGIAFVPQLENLSGLTESYEVNFFTRHTQTFYEPYLETTYNDLVEDDRNNFSLNKTNKLYLYLFENGNPINLDVLPIVDILDISGNPIDELSGIQTCMRTKGIYEVTIPPITQGKPPCTYYDRWDNLKLNGVNLPKITNEFVLKSFSSTYQIGSESVNPKQYGFDYYGIKQDEKIFNTDIRKVGVIIKQAFSTNKLINTIEAYYRVYVKEGQTEVQVQDWTKINRTPNEYYFIFDTRDKIPNEYFIDMKVISSGEVNTFKREIKFQVVNYK